MKKLASIAFGLLSLCTVSGAIDLTGLAPIGAFASYTAARDGVTVVCSDQSQVRF